jgi:hypothetical protein
MSWKRIFIVPFNLSTTRCIPRLRLNDFTSRKWLITDPALPLPLWLLTNGRDRTISFGHCVKCSMILSCTSVRPFTYSNSATTLTLEQCGNIKSHFKISVFRTKNGPLLWSSGQSFWLQIQRSQVRFPALPDFLRSSGSGTGSTQPREDN